MLHISIFCKCSSVSVKSSESHCEVPGLEKVGQYSLLRWLPHPLSPLNLFVPPVLSRRSWAVLLLPVKMKSAI